MPKKFPFTEILYEKNPLQHNPYHRAQTKSLGYRKHSSTDSYNRTLTVGGVRGVMVIVVGHGDTSSNPGWEWLHFT